VSTTVTRQDARRRDAADPLAAFRDRFVIDDDVVAYLDGNSLGRLPRSTAGRIRQAVEVEWGRRLIRSWQEQWMDLPVVVGDHLGEAVLGAAPGQTVVGDSTTVNLYKVVHAAAALRPGRRGLLIDEPNFPTDRYVVESVATQRGMEVRWLAADPAGGVTPDSLAPHLQGDVAAVVLSHVDYRTGFLADMAAVSSLVHEQDALVVWDLSHSAGAVPLRLDADGADFAVGCTYKYLNGGPGSPAYMYVAGRHLPDAAQPITGWFGAGDIFAMADRYQPSGGVRRMLSGTPNVLGMVAVAEGLAVVAEAGIDRIRAKSIELTELARRLAEDMIVPLGWRVASPADAGRRGSHLVVAGGGAGEVVDRMIHHGAIPDFRRPDLVRLGLSPLTTSFEEVWLGMEILRRAITESG
jgi:kynureninase